MVSLRTRTDAHRDEKSTYFRSGGLHPHCKIDRKVHQRHEILRRAGILSVDLLPTRDGGVPKSVTKSRHGLIEFWVLAASKNLGSDLSAFWGWMRI